MFRILISAKKNKFTSYQLEWYEKNYCLLYYLNNILYFTFFQAVCNAPMDYTACATLKRYYCQLCFLLNRFPFLVGDRVPGLNFTWLVLYNLVSESWFKTYNCVYLPIFSFAISLIMSKCGSSDKAFLIVTSKIPFPLGLYVCVI